MSHHATNWAIAQRGLKPATKIVLWHLADRHHPDHGCFPRQDTLASDCEMSRASVNEHLAELEARGLIRRERRVDQRTRRQLSTRYILGFEPEFAQEPCPESGHGPCPDLPQSRVQNLDTNSVIRTSNTTTPAAASAEVVTGPQTGDGLGDVAELSEIAEAERLILNRRAAEVQKDAWEADVVAACLAACGDGLSAVSRRLLVGLPDIPLGWLRDGALLDRDVLPILRERMAGADDRTIRTWEYFSAAVREAKQARLRGVARARAGRQKVPAASGAPADPQSALRFLADWINSDRYCPPSAVSNSHREALVAAGLVTRERLRERQIY